MKCFTWHLGEITQGITVNDVGIIIFGTDGTRRCEKVRCFPENPAEINEGLITEAHPVKGESSLGNDFYMLAKPEHTDLDDSRILVRILTKWIYARATIGTWETVTGSPENLVIGLGFHGTSKQVGCWRDGLVMMSHGDVVKIVPEGGHRTDIFALLCDENGVQSMSFNDFIATMAVSYSKL